MALADLTRWMDQLTGPRAIWFLKRLSGNDTLANKSHQAGPYIPKELLFTIFPSLDRKEVKNPDILFQMSVDSHRESKEVRAIWYNNKFHENKENGRDESRITRLGGGSSALLDPENTGALVVFAFVMEESERKRECRVWVCRSAYEEELIEDRIGPVEPGRAEVWAAEESLYPKLFMPEKKRERPCRLSPDQIPPAWLEKFPTGAEIICKTVQLRPEYGKNADRRLVERRACEYEIFRSVEEAIELPWVQKGFHSIDEFIARAQTVLQRRKARSGRSLELHAKEIFVEEGLVAGQHFEHQPESDPGKRPDFLFPSAAAYRNKSHPESQLRMLAVKTTCKDRWRQILNEADRIPQKHLLTLQEGVSVGQFREMSEAGVKLVVPQSLMKSYSKEIRSHLLTVKQFISEVNKLAGSV